MAKYEGEIFYSNLENPVGVKLDGKYWSNDLVRLIEFDPGNPNMYLYHYSKNDREYWYRYDNLYNLTIPWRRVPTEDVPRQYLAAILLDAYT